MSASHVAVCCRLPHGLVLHHPLDPSITVTLKGRNKATIIGAKYATTMVETGFWEAWHAANKDFTPLTSGAIYVVQSAAEESTADAKAKKTGLEPLVPSEHGVKTVPKDGDDEDDGKAAAA